MPAKTPIFSQLARTIPTSRTYCSSIREKLQTTQDYERLISADNFSRLDPVRLPSQYRHSTYSGTTHPLLTLASPSVQEESPSLPLASLPFRLGHGPVPRRYLRRVVGTHVLANSYTDDPPPQAPVADLAGAAVRAEGDGEDEGVVSLVGGHGAGCSRPVCSAGQAPGNGPARRHASRWPSVWALLASPRANTLAWPVARGLQRVAVDLHTIVRVKHGRQYGTKAVLGRTPKVGM